MFKISICDGCDKKCVLDIYSNEKDIDVEGNLCSEGINVAKNKIKSNKDILTTLIRIKGSEKYEVLPVKSSAPINKDLWIECSKALSRIYVGPNIKSGDIVCKNILNTGIDIISTKTLKK